MRTQSKTGAKSQSVCDKFNLFDFHDDNLLSVLMLPGAARRSNATIELRIADDATDRIKILAFRECANCRWHFDFDVLAHNALGGNVRGADAATDVAVSRRFVESLRRHWRVTYMPPLGKDQPIQRKLKELARFTLFRLRFFGGTTEILARNYTLKWERRGVK